MHIAFYYLNLSVIIIVVRVIKNLNQSIYFINSLVDILKYFFCGMVMTIDNYVRRFQFLSDLQLQM